MGLLKTFVVFVLVLSLYDLIMGKMTPVFQLFRYHLYAGEASEGISAPSEPDVSTFTLDDGRRIGMLICFDLMFASPMDRLANAEAVEAVVFPHYWYDELPFLTAPQAHFGHAVSDNLTILASGHNNLVTHLCKIDRNKTFVSSKKAWST